MKFDVVFSENYAILDFLQHLSPNYPSNSFKDNFENSKYNNSEYNELINEFNKINYFYWYNFPQYPYGNKIEGGTYFILARNLIESDNLEEFKIKSFGIIPNSDLNRLYNILYEFKKVYLETIYKPSEIKFKRQLKEVRKLIKTVDINSLFNHTKYFHKSVWDNSIPFVISLFPIPSPRSKGFTATAFYNQAIGGIPQGLTDYNKLLGVMFHEAFHILYDEQPLGVKKEIDKWFENSMSNNKIYAKLLFNESIITSLANGYLYRKFSGNLPKEAWYNNEYIANMAQEMFPLVENYMDNNKQIDKEFIYEYIKILDVKFPQWITEINHVMMQRYIVTQSKETYSEIRKKYRYYNISESSNKLNTLTLEKVKKHPITKIIVIEKDNKDKLELIKSSFNELKNWEYNSSKSFSYTKLLDDKTYIIILNSKNNDVSELLNSINLKQ